jgi:small GTP-binding protein
MAKAHDVSGELTAKIVLLGEAAVGKSSLAARFVRDEFQGNQESTIGAAFLSHAVTTPKGTVKFEIWDTAGQERYRSLAPMYYRGALAAIVVYDITSADSLKRSKSWITELKRGNENVIIALLGNKCDLDSSRAVPVSEGEATAAEEESMFFETSAKTGQNVDVVFQKVADKVLESGAATAPRPEPPGAKKIGKSTQGNKKKGPCK